MLTNALKAAVMDSRNEMENFLDALSWLDHSLDNIFKSLPGALRRGIDSDGFRVKANARFNELAFLSPDVEKQSLTIAELTPQAFVIVVAKPWGPHIDLLEFSAGLFTIFSSNKGARGFSSRESETKGEMKRVSFQRLLATSAIAAYLEALGGPKTFTSYEDMTTLLVDSFSDDMVHSSIHLKAERLFESALTKAGTTIGLGFVEATYSVQVPTAESWEDRVKESVKIKIRRSSAKSTLRVRFSTAGGTALAMTHFVPRFETVIFNPGITEVVVHVPLLSPTPAIAAAEAGSASRWFKCRLSTPTIDSDVDTTFPVVLVRDTIAVEISVADASKTWSLHRSRSHAPAVAGRPHSPKLLRLFDFVGISPKQARSLFVLGFRSLDDVVEASVDHLKETMAAVTIDDAAVLKFLEAVHEVRINRDADSCLAEAQVIDGIKVKVPYTALYEPKDVHGDELNDVLEERSFEFPQQRRLSSSILTSDYQFSGNILHDALVSSLKGNVEATQAKSMLEDFQASSNNRELMQQVGELKTALAKPLRGTLIQSTIQKQDVFRPVNQGVVSSKIKNRITPIPTTKSSQGPAESLQSQHGDFRDGGDNVDRTGSFSIEYVNAHRILEEIKRIRADLDLRAVKEAEREATTFLPTSALDSNKVVETVPPVTELVSRDENHIAKPPDEIPNFQQVTPGLAKDRQAQLSVSKIAFESVVAPDESVLLEERSDDVHDNVASAQMVRILQEAREAEAEAAARRQRMELLLQRSTPPGSGVGDHFDDVTSRRREADVALQERLNQAHTERKRLDTALQAAMKRESRSDLAVLHQTPDSFESIADRATFNAKKKRLEAQEEQLHLEEMMIAETEAEARAAAAARKARLEQERERVRLKIIAADNEIAEVEAVKAKIFAETARSERARAEERLRCEELLKNAEMECERIEAQIKIAAIAAKTDALKSEAAARTAIQAKEHRAYAEERRRALEAEAESDVRAAAVAEAEVAAAALAAAKAMEARSLAERERRRIEDAATKARNAELTVDLKMKALSEATRRRRSDVELLRHQLDADSVAAAEAEVRALGAAAEVDRLKNEEAVASATAEAAQKRAQMLRSNRSFIPISFRRNSRSSMIVESSISATTTGAVSTIPTVNSKTHSATSGSSERTHSLLQRLRERLQLLHEDEEASMSQMAMEALSVAHAAIADAADTVNDTLLVDHSSVVSESPSRRRPSGLFQSISSAIGFGHSKRPSSTHTVYDVHPKLAAAATAVELAEFEVLATKVGGANMARFICEVYRPIVGCSERLTDISPNEFFKLCGRTNVPHVTGLDIRDLKVLFRDLGVDYLEPSLQSLRVALKCIDSGEFSDVIEIVGSLTSYGRVNNDRSRARAHVKRAGNSLSFGVWEAAYDIEHRRASPVADALRSNSSSLHKGAQHNNTDLAVAHVGIKGRNVQSANRVDFTSNESSIKISAEYYFKEAALDLASVGRGGARMALFVKKVYRPIVECSQHLSTAKPVEVFRLCGKGKVISQTQCINLHEIKQMLRVLKIDGVSLGSTELKGAFKSIENCEFIDLNEAIAVAALDGVMVRQKNTTFGLQVQPIDSMTGYGYGHVSSINFGVWNVAHLVDRSARERAPRLYWKRAYRAIFKMPSEMRQQLQGIDL